MMGVPGYYLRDQIEHLQDELADAVKREEQLKNMLLECLEYFDQRADCDCDQDGFIPNEEMRIMMRIEEEL